MKNKIRNFFEIWDWRKLVLFVLAIVAVAGGTVTTVMYQLNKNIHTVEVTPQQQTKQSTVSTPQQEAPTQPVQSQQEAPTQPVQLQTSETAVSTNVSNGNAATQQTEQATQAQPTPQPANPTQPVQTQLTPPVQQKPVNPSQPAQPKPTPPVQPQPTPPAKTCKMVEYKIYPPKGRTEPKYTYPDGNYEIIVYIDDKGNYEARFYNKDGKFLKSMPGSSYEIETKEVCN